MKPKPPKSAVKRRTITRFSALNGMHLIRRLRKPIVNLLFNGILINIRKTRNRLKRSSKRLQRRMKYCPMRKVVHAMIGERILVSKPIMLEIILLKDSSSTLEEDSLVASEDLEDSLEDSLAALVEVISTLNSTLVKPIHIASILYQLLICL